MPSSKKLLKDAGITTVNTYVAMYEGLLPLEELIKIYPPTSEIELIKGYHDRHKYCSGDSVITHETWTTQENGRTTDRYSCEINGCDFIKKKNGKHYYQWRGSNTLESDKPILLDLLKELNEAKDKELENNKNKRMLKLDTPLDAVRVTLHELGYHSKAQQGALRVNCVGYCFVEFATKEYDVFVRFGYYGGYGGSASYSDITKLNIADPEFSNKVSGIMQRAKNILDWIAGRDADG